jgi:hypothetical protein
MLLSSCPTRAAWLLKLRLYSLLDETDRTSYSERTLKLHDKTPLDYGNLVESCRWLLTFPGTNQCM